MLTRSFDQSMRPLASLLQDVLRFLRALWGRLVRPPDTAAEASIDWEDGESR